MDPPLILFRKEVTLMASRTNQWQVELIRSDTARERKNETRNTF